MNPPAPDDPQPPPIHGLIRKVPNQKRAERTLEMIFEAAARVIETSGRNSLNIGSVAKTSGFSVGAVYQYFPNKEALTEAMAMRQVEAMHQAINEALTDPAIIGAGVNARRILRGMIKILGKRSRVASAMWLEAMNAPPDSQLHQAMQAMFGTIAAALRQEQRSAGAPLSEMGQFVLFRAMAGVITAAAEEQPHMMKLQAFEDEMVRLILGFFAMPTPVAKSP